MISVMRMLVSVIFAFLNVNVIQSSTTTDPNLCRPGVCCVNYFLRGGQCIACDVGTFGENCSQVCPDGFHGKFCLGRCPTECQLSCHKDTGKCQEEAYEENTSTFPTGQRIQKYNIDVDKKLSNITSFILGLLASHIVVVIAVLLLLVVTSYTTFLSTKYNRKTSQRDYQAVYQSDHAGVSKKEKSSTYTGLTLQNQSEYLTPSTGQHLTSSTGQYLTPMATERSGQYTEVL
ncbi:protein draper-like isoform X2 [Saccostrea cucullata]|uniref:protein draper-like isoform X2 n=1 Tax=Saccostrea cuccullata TaxID=36930 RepID=UPI002ED3C12D